MRVFAAPMTEPRGRTYGTDRRIAYACSWWRPRAPTWSYTSASLRAGLHSIGTTLLDVEAQPPLYVQAPLAAALSACGQRPWKYAGAYRRLQDRRVQRAVRQLQPDAVIEIADLVVPTCAPTWTYQDTNFAVALDLYDTLGRDQVSTIPAPRAILQRLADAESHALQKLDGVLAMGQWFGAYLVRAGLVPAHRVHAVGAGIRPEYCNRAQRVVRPRAERKRILFIGGDFYRKGGDALLAAVDRLHRQGSRPLRLTIAGPAVWPLDTPPPPWVDFRGTVSRAQVSALFDEHDLFAMPSRFEAYGIVFLEARAAGLPCVGRDAYAMPALIEPGIGGALWNSEDIDDLAQTIQTVLDDDALHERCARDAQAFAERNSWARVAERILLRMNGYQRA